jgi:hypothetical protein
VTQNEQRFKDKVVIVTGAANGIGHMLVVDGGLLSQQRSPQVDIFPLRRFPKLESE